MGDVAMTVSVIGEVRKSYPDLRITVLTRGAFKVFFRDIERIEFLPLDLGGRHKGFFGLLRLAADAKRAGVDAVADLHDVLRSKVVRFALRLAGCRTSRIDKGRREKRGLVKAGYRNSHSLTTTVERYREVFARMGFEIPSPQPPAHIARPIPDVVTDIAGPKNGVWTGLAPFAGHEGKAYPIELAEKLALILARNCDRVLLFGGGDRERAQTERIAALHENIVSVIGKTNLGGELDLISNLDAIVTMDSSALHMASLVGTRAVSLWGATHPYAGFYGLGQSPDDALQTEMECRPCSIYGNKPCKKGNYPCMHAIRPEAIAAKTLNIRENELV